MARGKGTKARRTSANAEGGDGGEPKESIHLPEPREDLPRALPRPAAAALVFIAAGAVLMLEILAVRLLAPYVGLTLETTTSIIGAALAGIAAGAAVGGYLADRTDTRLLIVGLLIGGGLLTLLTVPIVRWLGPGAQGSGDLAALGITLLALVPAAAVLSAVSPAVAHLQLHDLRVSGTVVGSLSAWATAGALIGTFGTGFVVVPLMPVSTAVLVIGLVLILVGVGLGTTTRLLPSAAVIGVIAGTLALGALSQASDGPCIRESKYHCLDVVGDEGSPSGHLLLDGVYNSYVDVEDPTHLEYAYTQWIADGINATNPGQRPLEIVFVGGGGLTLPRWLLETRPGSQAEVLEVDGEIVDFVEDRFGVSESEDLRVTVGDARMTMRDLESDSADVVVGDAFSGYTVPWHLTTAAWQDEVKRVLDTDGIYTLNMIDEGPLDLIEAEAATLLEAFPYVRMVARPGEDGSPFGGNFVFIASERRLGDSVGSGAQGAVTYDQSAVDELAEGADPLRDDYAPVDQLRTENY
jgi:spermidine synthase